MLKTRKLLCRHERTAQKRHTNLLIFFKNRMAVNVLINRNFKLLTLRKIPLCKIMFQSIIQSIRYTCPVWCDCGLIHVKILE